MTDAPVLHLSASAAATLVSRSPRHAWREHYLGGGEEREVTNLMRRGKLFDRLLFGTGPEVVIVDAKAWNTGEAKMQRHNAEAAGKIAVLKEKHEETRASAEAVRALLLDRGIDLRAANVMTQHRIKWLSDGVACKAFLDAVLVDVDGALVYDLKVVDDASTVRLDLRAGIQAAAYPEAVEAWQPSLVGRVKMQFIIAEADGGDLRIAEPDGTLRALGAARWRRAVATWGECVRKNEWPGYPRDVVRVEAKPWDLAEEMDAVIPQGGSRDIDF